MEFEFDENESIFGHSEQEEEVAEASAAESDFDEDQELLDVLGEGEESGGEQEEEEEEEDTDEEEDDHLVKFDEEMKKNYILENHPDILQQNYDEINALSKVVRDVYGSVIDPLHRTIPILTKFEKARILGLRTKQINSGSEPYVEVEKDIIDGYVIAEKELNEKVLPYIVVRPLPNGKKEYWPLNELELVDY